MRTLAPLSGLAVVVAALATCSVPPPSTPTPPPPADDARPRTAGDACTIDVGCAGELTCVVFPCVVAPCTNGSCQPVR